MKAIAEEDVPNVKMKEIKTEEQVIAGAMTKIGKDLEKDGLKQTLTALNPTVMILLQTLTIYRALGKMNRED
jgi:hypothetical protein